MKPTLLSVVPLVCALVLGAQPGEAQAAKPAPIAKVNGKPITQSQFERALQQATATGAADGEALRAAIKSQLIARELFRQEAEKQHLQNAPEVLEARDNAMIALYLRRALKPAPVAEEAVRAQYDAIVASLGSQEYKARVIAVADAALAASVAAQLKADPGRFAELAKTHSRAPSAIRGGELDWVSFKTPVEEGKTQNLPLPVAAAIAGLKPGEVTPEPIAYEGLHYLIRLDDVRPTQVPDYAKAAPLLRGMLERRALEQATAELVTRLIKNAKIELLDTPGRK